MLPRGGPKIFFASLRAQIVPPPKQKPSYAPEKEGAIVTQKLVLQQSKNVTAECTETLSPSSPPPSIQFSLPIMLVFLGHISFIHKSKCRLLVYTFNNIGVRHFWSIFLN